VLVQVPTVSLNNGVETPILGFGVFQIPAEETELAVVGALAAGYRHLDTAASYGNEEAVGRAIAASGIARGELFVTTKLWVQDAGEDSTKKAFESWGGFAEGRNNLFSDPTLTQIGAAHGKSIAQVVLRWLTQRNIVAIPKSVRPERMAQNLDVFDFTLTDDEMAHIATMDTGPSLFFDHRDPAMVSAIGNRSIHD